MKLLDERPLEVEHLVEVSFLRLSLSSRVRVPQVLPIQGFLDCIG